MKSLLRRIRGFSVEVSRFCLHRARRDVYFGRGRDACAAAHRGRALVPTPKSMSTLAQNLRTEARAVTRLLGGGNRERTYQSV